MGGIHLGETANLDADTSSGSVTVADVGGTATIKNSNGETKVGSVTGDMRIKSANGGITIGTAHAGVDANMVTPIRLVQKVADGMVERRFGRIVCITSGSVKAPIAGLDLSSGARVGLTGFLAGVARQVAHANVTINFLLPGLFATRRLAGVHAHNAETNGISIAEAEAQARERVPARRSGAPAVVGNACAFLCAASSGFITGQSLLIDGGAYPGVL